MSKRQTHRASGQSGFTMIELLVVLSILGVVMAAVFSQANEAQQRANTEKNKLDDFQQARDFVDQFFRDINQVGYPNARLLDTTQTFTPGLAPTLTNDYRVAIGLVRIDANEIRFEGDVDGTGIVQSMVYTVNGSGTCSGCLQRSEVPKVTGDPLTQQSQNWGTEVNGVTSTQIFTYYDTNGNLITGLPLDTSTTAGQQALASVKTIKISLTIQNNAVVDQRTGQPIQSNFEGEVSLNNCSMAVAGGGQPMSC